MATMLVPKSPAMIAINQTNSNRLLNEIVDAFETRRAQDQQTQIDAFLPDRADPEYARVALELMRVDLEHSWRDGSPKSLEEYKNRFGEVLSDHAALRELAYEDYRQRVQSGETIRRDDYRRFGVDTNGWPDEANKDLDESSDFGTVENLTGEFNRLVDSIQEFPVAGQTFGPYEIVEQIGQGAFARVYLARQRELADRVVVLKVGSLASKEHERLARLQHTNIVPIYSVHDVDSVSVICMPFFGLSTLADVLQHLRRSPLPPKSAAMIPRALADKRTAGPACTAGPDGASAFSISQDMYDGKTYESACVSIMQRVAAAMSHANDRGILHRDLKPANILLTDDGQPMLLDFNVSGDVVPGGATCLTVGGTLPYMSPEQLRSIRTGDANDARSDIYSFGVVFYELLTGVHPFSMHRLGAASTVQRQPDSADSNDSRSESPRQTSVADSVERALVERENKVPDVLGDNDSLSHGLANILAKCLQPDPADRYASADELQKDLDRHQNNLPLQFAKRDPARERLGKWCRRHPKLSSATAVTAAATALLLVIALFAVTKMQEVADRNAVIVANEVRQRLPQVRALMTAPDREGNAVEDGRVLASDLFERARAEDYASRLEPAERQTFEHDLVELQFLLDHVGHGPTSDAPFDRDLYRLTTLKAERGEMITALHDVLAGRANDAIVAFEAAVRREPLSFSHRQVLANTYVAAGRLDAADEAYSVCVAIDPSSFLSFYNRGLCRLDRGQFSEAAADFLAASELRPTSVEALINLGLAYKGQGDFESATNVLTDAIAREPDWPRPYFIRSRVRKSQKNHAGSKADLARGLELPPRTEKDWIARGIALLKSDPDAAYASFEQALQINPSSRSALRNMAHVISEHRRDTEEALSMLDRVVEISPGYLDDVISRAVLHARSGKTTEAIAEMERVLTQRRDGKTVIQAACVYALVGAENDGDGNAKTIKSHYRRRAISLVGEAITMDGRWLSVAARDPDLASIRGDREFKSIVSSALKLQRAVRQANQTTEAQ